jgi:hypothetical protein
MGERGGMHVAALEILGGGYNAIEIGPGLEAFRNGSLRAIERG